MSLTTPRVSRTPSPRMSGSARVYTWALDNSGDGGLSQIKKDEARTMLNLAVTNKPTFVAFQECYDSIVLEIDSKTAHMVEQLMHMGVA
jgi:hypothetical protein